MLLNILQLYIEYIVSFWNQNHSVLLALIRFHSFWLVVPLVVIRCHLSLLVVSLVVSRCHSLSLVVICCHSLSFVVPIVVIRSHSLLFVVTCCTTHCHSMYHLVCLFINDLSEQMFLVDYRRFWGILFDLVVFLWLIRFSFLSISDNRTWLNEKLGIFLT